MTQDIRKDLRIEEMSFTDRPSEKKKARTHKPEVDPGIEARQRGHISGEVVCKA
jgi:hypothetical protein